MCWFISCYQEWLSTGPRFFVFSVDEFWSYLHRLCSLWPIFSRQRATENHKKNWKLVLFFNDESYYFIIWYDESKFLFSCERRRKLARRWVVDFKFFNSTAYEHKHNIDNGISKLSYNKITHCQPKTSIIFYFNKNLCEKNLKFFQYFLEWIWVGLANFLDKIEMWLRPLDHRLLFSPVGGYWERMQFSKYRVYNELSHPLFWIVFILCKIDSAVRCNIGEYPTLEFKDSYHTCGVFATLAFFFINSVSNSRLNDDFYERVRF